MHHRTLTLLVVAMALIFGGPVGCGKKPLAAMEPDIPSALVSQFDYLPTPSDDTSSLHSLDNLNNLLEENLALIRNNRYSSYLLDGTYSPIDARLRFLTDQHLALTELGKALIKVDSTADSVDIMCFYTLAGDYKAGLSFAVTLDSHNLSRRGDFSKILQYSALCHLAQGDTALFHRDLDRSGEVYLYFHGEWGGPPSDAKKLEGRIRGLIDLIKTMTPLSDLAAISLAHDYLTATALDASPLLNTLQDELRLATNRESEHRSALKALLAFHDACHAGDVDKVIAFFPYDPPSPERVSQELQKIRLAPFVIVDMTFNVVYDNLEISSRTFSVKHDKLISEVISTPMKNTGGLWHSGMGGPPPPGDAGPPEDMGATMTPGLH